MSKDPFKVKGLINLLARRESEFASGADYVDWAVSALMSGLDTPALVVLAGLDISISAGEAEPYFKKALMELELEVPARETILRQYVRETAEKILSGEVSAREGCSLIHRLAVGPLNHPGDLQEWCYLWEGNGSTPDGGVRVLETSEVDDAINKFARHYVERERN